MTTSKSIIRDSEVCPVSATLLVERFWGGNIGEGLEEGHVHVKKYARYNLRIPNHNYEYNFVSNKILE